MNYLHVNLKMMQFYESRGNDHKNLGQRLLCPFLVVWYQLKVSYYCWRCPKVSIMIFLINANLMHNVAQGLRWFVVGQVVFIHVLLFLPPVNP